MEVNGEPISPENGNQIVLEASIYLLAKIELDEDEKALLVKLKLERSKCFMEFIYIELKDIQISFI
nr:unnamed protein product [Callosobruchus chinensis]